MKYNLLYLLIIITLYSCSFSKDEIQVARVNDSYLYKSDLEGIVAKGTSKSDSIAIVNNFIANWCKQKIKLDKAHYNLKESEIDIEKQVKEYRNSLVIYAYENQLVRQNLDTLISDQEIEQYYEVNKENFQLRSNIVIVRYVKTSNPKTIGPVKKLIKSTKDDDLVKLATYCKKRGISFYYNDEDWILFDDLLKEVPINSYNQESFLKNNRFFEVSDQGIHYLVYIMDFKIKEGNSPLAFEKEKIKNILLNKRKKVLLQKMEEEIYNEALKDKKIEIYDGN